MPAHCASDVVEYCFTSSLVFFRRTTSAYFVSRLIVATNTSQFISIAVVLDAGINASSPASMRLFLPLSVNDTYSSSNYTLRYATPFRLVAGSHMFGLLELVEYREIVPSIWDMIGLAPVRVKNHFTACKLT
jgi:hypothetical protein